MHFFCYTSLILLASLQLALFLPIRQSEDAKRIDIREVANETSNATACFDDEAHKVDVQCVNDTSPEEHLAAINALWTGLRYLWEYSNDLFDRSACPNALDPVNVVFPPPTSFKISTTAENAHQYVADWAGIIRAYGDNVITILDTNLTEEEQEQAETLYKIISGVLNNYKDVLEPFCSCDATEACPTFRPETAQEVDCNSLSNTGRYLSATSLEAEKLWISWIRWQIFQPAGLAFSPSSLPEWKEKYLS